MRKLLPLLAVCLSTAFSAFSQCPVGSTQAMLNWEYLDFFPSEPYGSYTTLATSQTQKFMFGGQVVTVTHNYTGTNAPGENADHTASILAGYSAEDLQFTMDGTVTFTFQNAVQNVRFSLYDIDLSQRVVITASNGGSPQLVTMTALSGSAVAVTGSGTTSASGKSIATAVGNASTDGQVNCDIAGPVTSFTITVDQSVVDTKGKEKETGAYWISNILACTPTVSMPTDYFSVSKPFTGQPGYVLTVRNDSIYYVNPATGKAKFLFADLGHTNINSMAYDPVNHYVYYVYSLSGAAGAINPNNKVLRRYDYNMDTLGVVLDDVTKIGVPTLTSGVESGAAAFYNGSLYLGIESSTYESIVWKVDFNSSFKPVAAAQQYGITGSGHDWADIGVVNGVLYDFDGSATNPDYYHMDLLTGSVAHYTPSAGLVPRQTAVDWKGQLYDVGGPGGGAGEIVPYLNNGTLDNAQKQSLTRNGIAETGSWGDAAEAFKPKADFGDAPSTYDPDPLSPAMHEIDPNLRLGSTSDNEWNKPSVPGTLADQDGSDENGLPYVTILNKSGSYQTSVNVYNNTGANATVGAWMDFNKNDVFDAGEGISVTVPTNASMQSIDLFWSNTGISLPDNSYTYLRIRVTSAVNGMTASNPTGFFDNGEVEDYRVLVSSNPLAVKLTGFEARKSADNKVSLTWSVTDEETGTKYEIEKSNDGQDWSMIHFHTAQSKRSKAAYESFDLSPYSGVNYYRLKVTKMDGTILYSTVRKVTFEKLIIVHITPNPASSSARLSIQSAQKASAHIRIVDMNGRVVFERAVVVEEGVNGYALPVQQFTGGIYQADVWIEGRRFTQQLLVRK